jgi:molybdopterin-guanine dinucleotide biosynthesis protein A/formate dehydrogenase assembly factor FdhD
MACCFERCGAAVFCGGRSRRMGADKALYLMNGDGQGLLAALAGELAGRFGEVVLVTNDRRKLAACAELLPFTQVEDLRPGAGPVGAILTALTHLPERPVFVLACDMPVIDWEIVKRLKDLMEAAGAQAALPRHGGRLEPLHAFYGPGAAPVMARGLDEGRSSVRENLDRMTTVFFFFPDPGEAGAALFSNINTAREARRAGFSLSGLAGREARPDGQAPPVECEVLDETPFELAVDGETILSRAALPWNLDDLARGLMLARGLIGGADDLESLLVSADRRRVEARLKPGLEPRPPGRPGAGSRPAWAPMDLAALFADFEGRTSPWPAALALDRACFAVPGEEEGPIFEDLTPLAALDKALGRLLVSRVPPGRSLVLSSGRADREMVDRVLRAGAGGFITRLGPTAAAVDLARAGGLFLAAPDPGQTYLMIYAD